MPGFVAPLAIIVHSLTGEIGEASGTLLAAVTHWNYRTISRGKDSLVGRLIHQDGSKFCMFESL